MLAIGRYTAGAALLVALGSHSLSADAQDAAYGSVEELGKALFFDVNLSRNRTQACATCHAPDAGFTDPRPNGFAEPVSRAVSLGDDGQSIGDRNAPTASYARYSPVFHRQDDGSYIGGLFLDGREKDLEGQAGGPPLNPSEMGMEGKAEVVARLQENADYVVAFRSHFADDLFDDVDAAFAAMTQSIAAFERTDELSPFDSRYDRYLKGEARFTDQEELGRVLFFSQQFTNCNLCHQLQKIPGAAEETFSNYQYHNIGTPVNVAVRSANGSGENFADLGLLANPEVSDPKQAGKFKVPTLRNVAVTGPYMHNGIFEDLRTVVQFYNRYNTDAPSAQINPETVKPWGETEFKNTLSVKELTTGPALDDQRVDALVAFLKTLTDARYEHLLDD